MKREKTVKFTEGQVKKFYLELSVQAPAVSELSAEMVDYWLKNPYQLKHVLKNVLAKKPTCEVRQILSLLIGSNSPIIKATSGQRYLSKAVSPFSK